ncbi:S-adenosylmethionine decarboxylase [Candidatus Woesearchaeota archaeon CG10_big_fil_rev_8_21_14_0_10_36_11]|nr:MAG: S-adenosylmethionine decarboxylase [Candidatus Woesearchaeota archaeon CG10_big_fil_rev_8_21_14_0_10_36_11]
MKKNVDWWWGKSVSIDIHTQDNALLKDKKAIKRFVKELTQELNMKRVGPTRVKRFGHKKLRGYSMIQFIETSSITAHFDEKGNRAFIDVFSCKEYSAQKIVRFCKSFFNATKVKSTVLDRV